MDAPVGIMKQEDRARQSFGRQGQHSGDVGIQSQTAQTQSAYEWLLEVYSDRRERKKKGRIRFIVRD